MSTQSDEVIPASSSSPVRKKSKIDNNEDDDPIQTLRALPTIRKRCLQIYEAGKRDELKHFAIKEEKLPDVVDYVHQVILSRFPEGTHTIPNHSRYRHFEPGSVDRISQLREKFGDVDQREVARRLVDLVMVSVLLDAGAGDSWKYAEGLSGQTFNRSEGLGVASFHMFTDGAFSSMPETNPYQADSVGLKAVTAESIRKGFQVDDATNPLVGVEGRAQLLGKLGSALEEHPEYFASTLAKEGKEEDLHYRAGYVVDYLFSQAKGEGGKKEVPIHTLWHVVMEGLQSIWPSGGGRTSLAGINLGDVWPHSALNSEEGEKDAAASLARGYVPFHKLSQWLTYSLLEPLTEAGLTLTGTDDLTGLPEYRNGGLFVDLGVLTPKSPDTLITGHLPSSEVIVEWRALTVVLLDKVARLLREKIGTDAQVLPLVKVLEGGTWAAGRKIAKEKRPETAGPPITIISDGTVF